MQHLLKLTGAAILAAALAAGLLAPAARPADQQAGTSAPAPTRPPMVGTAPPAADPFVAAQAAAMRPEQAGDLARAGEWDRYRIAAALSPADLTVRGTLSVELTNRSGAPYERLYFRLYPNHPDFGGRLDVTGAAVDGQPVGSGTEQRDTLLWLALPRPLPPGGRATAELRFATRTPRDASARTFGAHNFEAGLWSLANFYPVLARHLGAGGWDRRPIESRGDFTVTDVALYEVAVDAPAGWDLITTGVRVSAEPAAAGVRRERFVSGPQREFYLGAAQGLEQASATVEGTRVVSRYQRDDAAAGRRALAVGERALRAFNARFGPYPLAELEIVQGAMTQFLGMEYPGVVLIEQRLYERNGAGLETTVAHEIGHQWWYSQVGNDAQGEPWLDEGLTSYAQVLYYEDIGERRQADAELAALRDMYARARQSGRDAPLGSPPAALRGNYVPIVYGKGALFFHALRARVGEEAFGRFLRDYYAAGRYGEVAGPDLLRAAEGACGCELDAMYRDWVQTAAPVPLP
jgi:hypothetical protein